MASNMPKDRKTVLLTLIATVALLNVFNLALMAYTLCTARERQEQEVRTTVENLALLLDQSVTAMIREVDLSLREIQHNLEIGLRQRGTIAREDAETLVALREEWLSGVAEIRVTDSTGAVLLGHGVTAETDVSYEDRPFFNEHRMQTDDRMLASKLLNGRIAGTWINVFSRRYNHPDGRFAGIVTAAIPASNFRKLLSGLELGPRGIALMRDSDLTLIARFPPSESPAGKVGSIGGSTELTDIIASGVARATFYSDRTADGINRIDAYRKLSLMPAFVVVGLGEEDYLAQWWDDVRKGSILSALFLFVTICAAWMLWRLLDANERANRRNQVLLQNASDGIHITDLQGNVIEASDAFCNMLGYPRHEVIGMNVRQWDAHLSPEEISDKVRRTCDSRAVHTFESYHRHRGGEIFPVEITTFPLELDGKPMLFNSARDVTERRQSAEALRIAARAFESQVGMVIVDEHQKILRINEAFTQVTGYTAEEAVGRTPRMLHSGRQDAAFYASLWAELERTGSWQGEIWNRRKNGEIYPQAMSIGAVKDEKGKITHYVATIIDITSRKSSEEQAQRLAFFDPLTQLPNRRLLMERLQHALRSCARRTTRGALLFIDLDNFKTVNDTVGHHAGDRLLEQVAEILTNCVRKEDTVARLGGDEFVVMLESLSANDADASQRAEAVARHILQALHKTFQVGSSEHRCSASIGITLFGENADENVDEPLKRADLAMYQAKVAGRNNLRFFDPQMQADLRARAELEAGLWLAYETGRFFLLYQPQVTAAGQITGVEALLRCHHPQRGLVSPADFIPLAEENGLILPLGRWVLETACTKLAHWAVAPHTAQLSISVNVSAREIRQDGFVDDVLAILERTGANPARLKLELTESSLVTQIESVIEKMEALKARGVGFSLDDFGTGYSSLAYLKRLPLDELKIDQGFVRDILIDPNDAAIARMVIVLAESLGLAVLAEGVETEAQRDFLALQGCDAYQGYLFSRPLADDALEERLAASSPTNAHAQGVHS